MHKVWVCQKTTPLRMWIPVISLLQKLFQTLKFAHLQVSFICVLVANKCTAVRGESRV